MKRLSRIIFAFWITGAGFAEAQQFLLGQGPAGINLQYDYGLRGLPIPNAMIGQREFIQNFTDIPSARRLFLENQVEQGDALISQSMCLDCQVVSPADAIIKFRGATGADEWLARITDVETWRQRDNQFLCDVAIETLFQAVCGADRSCRIEDRYAEMCIDGALDEDAIKLCTSIEQNYVDACFGEANTCEPAYGMTTATVGRTTNLETEAICTVSVFKVVDQFTGQQRTISATAQHCLEEEEGETLFSHGLSYGSGISLNNYLPTTLTALDEAPFELDIGSKVLLMDAGDYVSELEIGSPVLFRQTYFLGFNAISYARHQMAEKHGLEGMKGGYMLCDSSPLCTITKVSNNNLQHTCQSTGGGSGGALIQKNDDGQFVLVGLNEGAYRSGVVAFNIGYTFD